MIHFGKSSLRCLLVIWLICFFSIFFYPPFSCAATVKVDIIHSRDQYPVGVAYPILLRINIPAPWYIPSTKENEDSLMPTELSFSPSSGIQLTDIRFPPAEVKRFKYTERPVKVFSGSIMVHTLMMVGADSPTGKHVIEGLLSYHACTSQVCLAPEEVPISIALWTVPAGTETQKINKTLFLSADGGPQLQESSNRLRLGAGFWATLLFCFLGGLALNLTPCVYPLIPITVSYFGARSRKVSKRPIVHGILYIIGIAVVNASLGLMASLTGGMLGATLQNPIVLIVVAGIMAALALSFFGLYEIQVPRGWTRLASKNFGGYFGTLFMGLTLGFVAAPCLGPFILGLLTYVGQKGDPYLGFIYFFTLSIGLGFPLAVLAVFSGTLEKMPLSGGWMEWIKKVLGWVLLGMACYILMPIITVQLWRGTLFAALLVAAGLHLGWLEKSSVGPGLFSFLKKGLSVVLIIIAAMTCFTSIQKKEGVLWQSYEPKRLEEAIGSGRPVLLDFYADWCGPCRKMDKKVFTHPEVIELSKKFILIRIDLTTNHPGQEKLLYRYNIRGIPTIIFINTNGIEERHLRVQELVDWVDVIKRMKQALEAS